MSCHGCNLVLPKLDSRDLLVFELDFHYGFGGELITLYFSFMVTFLCVCFDYFHYASQVKMSIKRFIWS